jgi:hypothetical protein
MVQAFGEFAQLKCMSRQQAPAELPAALGAGETVTAVFVKQGAVLGSRRSFVSTAATDHKQLQARFDQNMRMDVTARNERPEALKLYWLNGPSEAFTATLQPLEAFGLQSFPSQDRVRLKQNEQ